MPSPRGSDRRSREFGYLAALLAGSGIGVALGLASGYMSRDNAEGIALGFLMFAALYLIWLWWRERRSDS